MHPIDPKIIERLNLTCGDEPIRFIGLGAHDFQIGYASVRRLQSLFRIAFFIKGINYTWNDSPLDLPIWLLIGQVPSSFELTSSHSIKMKLESGDWLEFFTEDSAYEDLIIEFCTENNKLELSVF